jgi:four helix bundle protein
MSARDFLAKVYISLKETAETLYWLELLHDTEYLDENEYKNLYQECSELKKMLSATTKTLQKRLMETKD